MLHRYTLKITVKPFVLFMVALCLPAFVLAGQPLQDSVARRIFGRMVDVYAKAKTYQDRVTVTDVLFKPDGKEIQSTTERVGTLAFDPATRRFRFEYETRKPFYAYPGDRYIVCGEGEQARTWWTQYNKIDNRPSLTEAMEAATSVSRGLAADLPGLVMQDSVRIGWSLGEMTNLRYLGTGELDGHRCNQISGLDSSGRQLVLWIDQSTSTLLGIDKGKARLGSLFPGLSTLRFAPVLNQPITGQAAAFDVPSMYGHWFQLVISCLLRTVPLVLIMLLANRLFKRFGKRPLTT